MKNTIAKTPLWGVLWTCHFWTCYLLNSDSIVTQLSTEIWSLVGYGLSRRMGEQFFYCTKQKYLDSEPKGMDSSPHGSRSLFKKTYYRTPTFLPHSFARRIKWNNSYKVLGRLWSTQSCLTYTEEGKYYLENNQTFNFWKK
jgi:hypothetical protein